MSDSFVTDPVVRTRFCSFRLPRRAMELNLALMAVMGGVLLCSLALGETRLAPGEVWAALTGAGEVGHGLLVNAIRLPRSCAALTAGAALGLAGALLQTLTRNRLASPEVLGVNDGGLMAVMIVVLFLPSASSALWMVSAGGAYLAFLLLMVFSRDIGAHGHRFLVIGIGLSQLLRAVNELMLSAGQLQHVTAVYVWSVGSFVGRGYAEALPVSAGVLFCLGWSWRLQRDIDLFSYGEATAAGVGVRTTSVKIQTVLLAAVSAGLGISVGGPLAFVALAAPVAYARLLGSPRLSLLGAALCGGGMTLTGDWVGRILLAPIELPAGLVCRTLGGLFLLWLLVHPKGRGR